MNTSVLLVQPNRQLFAEFANGMLKVYFNRNNPNLDRQAWVNSVNPDQTPHNAASDRSTLFAIQYNRFYTYQQVIKKYV